MDLVSIGGVIVTIITGGGYWAWAVYTRSADKKEALKHGAPPAAAENPRAKPSPGQLSIRDSDYLPACMQYSKAVAAWFHERFQLLEGYAKDESTRLGDPTTRHEVLAQIAKNVTGFPGGIYLLDEVSSVITQHTPKSDCPDITGFLANGRPYWDDCRKLLKPIVCNAVRSTNRPVEILVVAVPRFDAAGRFVGILDGVIDVLSAPFSMMASDTLRFHHPNHVFGAVRLLLLDRNTRIIGSSNEDSDGTKSVGENPTVRRLIDALGDKLVFVNEAGAISHVPGTPFLAVCHAHS